MRRTALPNAPDYALHKRHTAKRSHQIQSVGVRSYLPGDGCRDGHGQLLGLVTPQTLVQADDLVAHPYAGDLIVQEAGVAVADNGENAAQKLAVQRAARKLQVVQSLRGQNRRASSTISSTSLPS